MTHNFHAQKTFPEARTYLETLLNYTFANRELLREALHAGGSINIDGRDIREANKRYATLGDAAVNLVIATYGYTAGYSRGKSGAPTMRSRLIIRAEKMDDHIQDITCDANLERIGRTYGLAGCLTVPGDQEGVSQKMMATAVPAILGAMFEDSERNIAVVRHGMAALGLSGCLERWGMSP